MTTLRKIIDRVISPVTMISGIKNIIQTFCLLIALMMSSQAMAASYGANLVLNGDAETNSLANWTNSGPVFVALSPSGSGVSNSPSGGYAFDYYPGSASGNESLSQIIDITSLAADIAAGSVRAVLSGEVKKFYAASNCILRVQELDASNALLQTSEIDGNTSGDVWVTSSVTIANLNTNTRKLNVILYAQVSTNTDDYIEFDNIQLVLSRSPTLTTTTVSTYGATSATLGGNVTADCGATVTGRGVVYSSTDLTPTIGEPGVTQDANGSGTGTFSELIASLSPATTYYVQAYATNSVGTSYGGVVNFATNADAPTVSTQAASAIAATSATGNGTITATNGVNATTRGVIYYAYTNTDKIIGDAGVTNVSENGNFGTGAFTASQTSLSVNTQYNTRAYAVNAIGTGYGARVAFWTLANVPAAPTVNNPTATTLDVSVNVNSNPSGTEFTIQETGTGNYVQADGTLGAGAVWQTAATWGTKTVTGLTTGSTYTFQVKARNGGSTETSFGATASGTPVAAPTVTTQAASSISATAATGNGNITATNGANATTRGAIYWAYSNTDKIIGDAGVTNISENGSFGTGAFNASLTSLSVNTQYNARAYATSANGTGYGARVAFWTLANVPSAPTVNNPTATTLDVAVNVNSNPSGTEFAIQETSTGNYVQADGTLGAGAVWQNAVTWGTKTVTGLTTGTTYTFQVKARNGGSTETAFGATASGVPVAATLTVTNTNDSGAGSLRDTIAGANPGDAITFNAALNGQTITLSSQITIDKDLTINGPGAASLSISGGGSVRIFEVNAGKTVQIAGLTLANGSWFDGPSLFNRGILTISNALITGNHAVASSGSGIYNETGATLTVSGCTITGNIADAFGGGVYNNIGSTATISNTTITVNTASTGSGIYNNLLSNLTVENSTISGNSAVGVYNDDTALIRNSILWGNGGSEIYNGDTITVTNSIVQGGYAGAGNLNVDPKLGPLANNGGPTRTMMLLSGSPAINAGNCATGPAADQRGMARPQDATCDIGAYERGAVASVIATGGSPQSAIINAAFATPLSAKVTDSLGGLLDGISVTFAGPGSGAGITAGGSVNTASNGIAAFSPAANATAGAYTVTATVAALTANFNLTNSKVSQAIAFGAAPTVAVGGNGTVSATGGASGNAVTFSSQTAPVCTVSGTTVTGITAGSCTIAAAQAGNANYNAAATVTQSFTIGKGSQTITFGLAPTVAAGSSGTVSAIATSGLAVGFSSTTPGICTVSGSTVTGVTVGTCTIAANQGGDANYLAASQATQSFTVGKGTQTIVFGVAPTVIVGSTGTVTATGGASTSPVLFSSMTPSVCSVAGATFTAITTGTCIIAANQAGDSSYNAASQATQNITVAYSTTAPTLTVSTLADSSVTNNATLNVSGTATAINGITSVTVNGTAVTLAQDNSFSTAVTLQQGKNTIATVATDNAGLTTTDSRSITLDTTSPVTTITSPADNSTLAAASVTITGTVDKSATVQATVNSGSPQSAAMDGNTFTIIVNLADGSNTITVSATDLAGNSASIKRTVVSDTTKPTLAISDPAQDITTSQPSLTISGTVSDTLTAVTVSIACDGQTYAPQVANGSFQQQISFTGAKQYAIVVTATDLAGNSATTQRNVIYAPSTALPTGDINNDGTVDIADALLTLQMAVKLATPTPAQLAAGDVAPLVGDKPAPDGTIDIGDAVVILGKVVGILTW
ncbi:bacillopeptidase F precursor [Geobacter sp. OR-1]|uniref:beta strand repeat-containing protein n=1 Tax=Geobacter sp. OR-1 TaxID=1266765 RepID=UPI0005423655|nr:choice-of-anchor Q domain-containing protein [Geobacter sp. OR-1]GAM10888.1 bacillopeptidase F precursor [Geobacter sp. OR-1]